MKLDKPKAWWMRRAQTEGDSPVSVGGRNIALETARNLRQLARIRRAKGEDVTLLPDDCERIADLIDGGRDAE